MSQQKNYAAYNHAKIQMIGFIAEVFNENSEKVGAYSRTIGDKGTKVAKSRIAVNLYNQQEPDYYDLVAYGNENNSHLHDLLINYAQKGAKVFVEGTPKLNKDAKEKNKYYPSIVIDKLIYLSPLEKNEKEETTQAPQNKPQRFSTPAQKAPQKVTVPNDEDDFLNDFFNQSDF